MIPKPFLVFKSYYRWFQKFNYSVLHPLKSNHLFWFSLRWLFNKLGFLGFRYLATRLNLIECTWWGAQLHDYIVPLGNMDSRMLTPHFSESFWHTLWNNLVPVYYYLLSWWVRIWCNISHPIFVKFTIAYFSLIGMHNQITFMNIL